jgi:hypothetical protein
MHGNVLRSRSSLDGVTAGRLASLLAVSLAGAVVTLGQSEGPVVFEHVNIVRMLDGTIARDATLVVDGDRIAGSERVAAGARRIDARGAFVIPGLWDMHVHVNEDASWMLPLSAAMGVVGMRDMGGRLDAISGLRQLSGAAGMPQVLLSGPILSGAVDDDDDRLVKLARPAEVAAALDRLVASRVDHVKVHDWLTAETWRRITDEARKRALPVVGHVPVHVNARDAAGRQKSVEHLGAAWGGMLLDVSSREAPLKRKVRDRMLAAKGPQELAALFTPALWLEIVDSYSAAKAAALAREFSRAGTFVCPTLYTFAWLPSRDAGAAEATDARLPYLPAERRAILPAAEPPPDAETVKSRTAVFRARQRLVLDLHNGGTTLLAGTDYAQYPLVFPGFTLHDELSQLVDAGLSPLDALRSATVNVGRYLGDRSIGCLDNGCRADVVFLEANPLEDIRHVGRVSAVVVRGQYLDAARRQERLRALRRASASRGLPADRNDRRADARAGS